MLESASLLRQILLDADNDALRLEYAEILEKAGDKPRAELIRIQCRLSKLDRRDPEASYLYNRMLSLDQEGRNRWIRPLLDVMPHLDPVLGIGFRRGFVECLSLRAADFLAHAPALFDRAPIRVLALSEVKPHFPAVCQSPYLQRIQILIVKPGRSPIGSADILHLVSSPHVRHLRGLGLSFNPLLDAGLEAIALSSELTQLEQLFVAECEIGDPGLITLSRSSVARTLCALNLQGNYITDKGAKALALSTSFCSLNKLYLDSFAEVLDPDRPRNPISREWQEALLTRYGANACSFVADPYVSLPSLTEWY